MPSLLPFSMHDSPSACVPLKQQQQQQQQAAASILEEQNWLHTEEEEGEEEEDGEGKKMSGARALARVPPCSVPRKKKRELVRPTDRQTDTLHLLERNHSFGNAPTMSFSHDYYDDYRSSDLPACHRC